MKKSLGKHPEGWHAWIDAGGVPLLFHIFSWKYKKRRNEVSSWTHTDDDCHKRSPFCGLKRRYLTLVFQCSYFRVFVLYYSDAGFIAIVILQDYVEWCPLQVRRFKKTELLIQE